MSNWRLCVEGEELGVLHDIDRIPFWRKERFYEPLVSVLLWFIKKHFAKKETLRKGLHVVAFFVQATRPRSPRRKPALPDSQLAMICLSCTSAIARVWRDVPNTAHEQVLSREPRSPCKRTRKVRFMIFYLKQSQPTHSRSEMHYVNNNNNNKKRELMRCSPRLYVMRVS